MNPVKGCLVKRGRLYYAQWYANDRRFRISTKQTVRRDAEKVLARLAAPFAANDSVHNLETIRARLEGAKSEAATLDENLHPPLRIVEAVAAYKASERKPDSGARTLDGYVSQFGRFADWMKEEYPGVALLRDVTREHVKGYVADMSGLTPSAFNQHVNTLARFWAILSDEARAASNPWTKDKVRRRTIDKIAHRKRALSIKEASAAIAAAEGDIRPLLIIVACTGQRLGDICRLEWSSVDLRAGVLTIVPHKTRRRKGTSVFVPILPQARAVLNACSRHGRFVFPKLAALYAKDRGTTIAKAIRATFTRAGIATRREEKDADRAVVEVGAHSLRHTFNTLARLVGMPDAVVQKITGHASAAMTDHYTQFDRALISRLARNFAALPAMDVKSPLALPASTTGTGEPAGATVAAAAVLALADKLSAETWATVRDELRTLAKGVLT